MNLFDKLFNKAMICENGCWEYAGLRDEKGYGTIWSDGKHQRAHRVAFILCVDDIPEGMQVCHSCDNPPCVNPAHLFVGTNKDNSDDMWVKGRGVTSPGQSHGMAKLLEREVLQIKKLIAEGILNSREIGDLYCVHKATIKDIKAGRTWSHIGGH